MFGRIIYYIMGYVKLEIRGVFPERFINLCAKENIMCFDLKRKGEGLSCKILKKDFSKIDLIIKKSQSELLSFKEKGVISNIKRYRFKYGLFAGVILFFGMIFLMSQFVWDIEVFGNEELSTEKVLRILESENVKVGTYIKNIDLNELKENVILKSKVMSFVNINIKGTKITVEVKERINKPKIVPKDKPCDIIALRDGYILDIRGYEGENLVKRGDSVVAGQTLISGMIQGREGIRTVHSIGEIKARTYRRFSCEIPKKYFERIETGKEKNKYLLKIFGFRLRFYFNEEVPFSEYDFKEEQKNISIFGDFSLPFGIVKKSYKEIYLLEKYNTPETALEIAEQKVVEYEKEMLSGMEVEEKEIIKNEDEANYYIVAEYSIIEEIGMEKEIEV
ncbi:MAG: sporulation protein YqfD [Clostridia bacterium]|nr:sporulation protein YqfD [Clostridia bacterium]